MPENANDSLLHLVIGSTGAGKSTYSLRLAEELGAVRFVIDEWMQALYGDDCPVDAGHDWYMPRIRRCTRQILNVALQLASRGSSSVLEIGLTQRRARQEFYRQVDQAGLGLRLHVIEAPREVRWQRVQSRNRERGTTFALEVTRDMFDFVETMWEPPDEVECRERDTKRIRSA